MAQFRATIESDSPGEVAERLEEAGLTLLGPWASGAEVDARMLGLTEELDVAALLEANDASAAAERVQEILGGRARVQIVGVTPAPSEG